MPQKSTNASAAACTKLRIALAKCEQATSGRCEASSAACDKLRAKVKACLEANDKQ